jgi:hypothetical protein
MAAIQAGLPGFHDGLTTLYNSIRQVLAAFEEARSGPADTAADPVLAPAVRELLAGLRTALRAEHLKEVDRLSTEMERIETGGAAGQELARISDQILLAEYGEAVNIIDELIGSE